MSSWWNKPRCVKIVVDTPGWFDIHAESLATRIARHGDEVQILRDANRISSSDVTFYLSCMKITPPEILARSRLNLVAHASDLPKGRGFSPIVWQILNGENTIPVSLLYAADNVDSGDIVIQEKLKFEGHELNEEIRNALGNIIVDMCERFLRSKEVPAGRSQVGEASWYPRRTWKDSELDPQLTIAEQFEILRVVDNERYPAFIKFRGHTYKITITKTGDGGAPN